MSFNSFALIEIYLKCYYKAIVKYKNLNEKSDIKLERIIVLNANNNILMD